MSENREKKNHLDFLQGLGTVPSHLPSMASLASTASLSSLSTLKSLSFRPSNRYKDQSHLAQAFTKHNES